LNSFTTKLLSSAGEGASMSGGGEILPSSQKTADSTIFPSPQESINRTYPKASAGRDFCPYYRTTAPLAQPTPQAEDRFLASRPFIGPIQKGSEGSI
jgi:hypothetical protein